MPSIRGKSIKATAQDVSEGYVSVNPLFLKSFDSETLKEIYSEIMQVQTEIRADRFPHNDTAAIRWRNTRLQRLHSAAMIIRNFARDRKIRII